jgi:hypothetical protein
MNKRITLHPDTNLFSIVMKILRTHFNTYSAERISKIVTINNAGKDSGQYRFLIEWQDQDQSSCEIFKILE